jgi:hypothetical protein
VTKHRKRVSPENAYDRFYDRAKAYGYTVLVGRLFDTDAKAVMLQVIAVRGDSEHYGAAVTDVNELAASVAGLDELLGREAA